MLVDFSEPEAVQERSWDDVQPSWFPEASGIDFGSTFGSKNVVVSTMLGKSAASFFRCGWRSLIRSVSSESLLSFGSARKAHARAKLWKTQHLFMFFQVSPSRRRQHKEAISHPKRYQKKRNNRGQTREKIAVSASCAGAATEGPPGGQNGVRNRRESPQEHSRMIPRALPARPRHGF